MRFLTTVLAFAALAAASEGREEKSAFRPGQPGTAFAPAPGTTTSTICRRWIDCVDGSWNNQRCTGGRYCRGGWEQGGSNKAAELEESTKEEKSAFRPGQPGTAFAPAPGTTTSTICRRWIDCVDGSWNNQNCTGGRYCRGGWEQGGSNKAAELEESTKEEKSAFRPGQPGTAFAPAPGTTTSTICRRWIDCVDGSWNNQNCTGGRYCRGGWEQGGSNKAAELEESTKEEKSAFRPGQPGTAFAPAPGTTTSTICRRWIDCVDGSWNNQNCTGGRYCRGGWEQGGSNKAAELEESTKEEKSAFRPGQPGTAFAPAPGTTTSTICRRWIDCVDGSWNNQRCTGGRYCRGGWEQGGSNKAAELEESTKEEKSAFRPGQPGTAFAPAPGTTTSTICRRWIDCVDGSWNNQRCTGGRYCRGGWEQGGSNKAAELEESTKEEKSAFRPGQPGTAFAPAPGTTTSTICRRWIDCVDGSWNNQRCTGGRYCRGGWEQGGSNKAAELEESTKEEKSAFRPGQPGTAFAPAPGTTTSTICRRWIDCVDGSWNNQRCTGGRYCRGGWEQGGSNKAAELEESTKEEKSAFRPGQPGTAFAPAPGTTTSTICRRWIDCVDGSWNNQRCTGGRYCRGGWEQGGSNKAAELEESTKEEKSAFRPGQPGTAFAPAPGTTTSTICRRWIDCVDGSWNNQRCTGGRYCRGGWEQGGSNKAAELEESTKEEKSAFRPGQPGTAFAPAPGTTTSTICRRWIDCVDGSWNNQRCTGGRYCRGGWGEGGSNKAAELEESTKEEKSAFRPGQPGTAFAPAPGTTTSTICRRWIDCVDGSWNNQRCTGGRYCRGGWEEGGSNKAAELEESTKEESSIFLP